MAEIKNIAETLVNLSVKEVKELTDILKDEYGIEPAAVATAAPAASSGDADQGKPAEKTNFNVVLKEVGGQKLNVVKLVKEVTGMGLKESKGLVDEAPKTIKENVIKDEAESMKKTFEEIGAVIELQ